MKKSLKVSLGSVVVAGALGAVLIPAVVGLGDDRARTARRSWRRCASDTVAAETSFTNEKSFNERDREAR